jgi:hypothetical protein
MGRSARDNDRQSQQASRRDRTSRWEIRAGSVVKMICTHIILATWSGPVRSEVHLLWETNRETENPRLEPAGAPNEYAYAVSVTTFVSVTWPRH